MILTRDGLQLVVFRTDAIFTAFKCSVDPLMLSSKHAMPNPTRQIYLNAAQAVKLD